MNCSSLTPHPAMNTAVLYDCVFLLVANIETEQKGIAGLSKEIKQMQLDMVRLNSIIAERTGREQHLIQDTALLESDFVGELKVSPVCDLVK